MFIHEDKVKFKRVEVSLTQDDIEDAVHEYIKKKAPQFVGADISSIDWSFDDYADDGRGKNIEFVFRVPCLDATAPTCSKNCSNC